MSNGVKKVKLKDYKKEIKLIWQYVSWEKKPLIAGVIFGLATAAISAIIPYLYGRITDVAIFELKKFEIIGGLLLLWLFLSLWRDYFSRKVERYAVNISEQASQQIIIDLTEHLIKLPLSFHREQKKGKMIGRITRGADQIGFAIQNFAFYIFPELFTFLIAVAILFWAQWQLALLLVVLVSFYIGITVKKVEPLIRYQEAVWQAWEKAYGKIHEAILSAEVIKAHATEAEEKRRHKFLFGRAMARFVGWLKYWISIDAWQESILSIGFVAIFATGILLLISQKITPGQLIMSVGYYSLVIQPLAQLTWRYRVALNSLVSARRAFKIFSYKKEKEFAGAGDYPIKGAIQFQNIDFSYGKKQAKVLLGLSFKVRRGQTVALVGESGVGKSTLVNLISRYFLPQKGRILIDGKDIKKFTLKSLRKQIAAVPQEVVLFHDTIANNIKYSQPRAEKRDILKAAKIANAHGFIQKLPKKYDSMVGERGVKLSVGQKDRVGIARAILRDPKILILDEPTSNLDAESERLIQQSLKRIMKGRTTFIIAHRLSTIVEADKILVLQKGRLTQEGPHKKLIKQEGLYKKLYTLQLMK